LIGIWIVAHWQIIGSPQKIDLIELGPGRGTLFTDMLRTFKSFQPFRDSIKEIHLVESSPWLRNLQKHTLCSKPDTPIPTPPREAHEIDSAVSLDGFKINWHSNLKSIPTGNKSFIVAHEFFDALPVHQFEFTNSGWCEVLIDLDDSPESPHHFRLTISQKPTVYSKTLMTKERFPNPKIGDRVEISPDSWAVVSELAERLHDHGGAALIIDYGEETHIADSLRAIKSHKFQHPLLNPGNADLSADVNFSFLKQAALSHIKPVACTVPLTQNKFLLSMGIQARLQLLHEENPSMGDELVAAFQRLTSPKEMGTKYKFLCLHDPKDPKPLPF